MCRKYKFIADIDNKSVADFISYAVRLKKLYFIFGCIALINIISTFKREGLVIRWLQVLGIVLYAGIIANLTWLDTMTPTDTAMRTTVRAVLALLVLNTFNNLASFVYLIATDYSWTLFFSLFSLILQVTTWYIFYHFLVRIDQEATVGTIEEGLNPDPSAPFPEAVAEVIPRAVPVAHVAYPVAHNDNLNKV